MQRKSFFTGRYEGYSFRGFQKDLLSGLVVGIIAIPLGMAFAIASGVKPEYGIYTTIFAGILISLFGGSKYQIGGPTGAFIPILFGIVMTYGYENLLIAGFLAGIILLLMGFFRLGSLIKFIPKPVTIGFTSGIAVIIFSGQIANFLGLENIEKHEYFLQNMREIIVHIDTINIYSLLTAGICLMTVLLTPKFLPKIPGPLIGLLVSTVIASIFYPGQIATIGTVFGEIPSSLPRLQLPEITLEKIRLLIGPAFVIALLGSIESLLSAVVADGMTNGKHNSNRELKGQGIANIITPLFGGIPATGAIARTATNIKTGAVSPFSGIIHGAVVLLVLVLFAPYASTIPLASMAPILMVVAWNMSEKHVFKHILKTKTEDSIVLVVTFLLTVFVNLTIAVQIGLLLALVLFTKRMSDILVTAKVLPNPLHKNKKVESTMVTKNRDCPQISIYSVEGPLFFGAAQSFSQTIMKTIHYKPRVLLLRMGKVPFMDITGEASLASIVRHFSKSGVVLIAGINAQPKSVLQRTGLYDVIGEEHFFEHTGDAINLALALLTKDKCLGCKHFAFNECKALSQGNEMLSQKKLLSSS
ncbi:sulfate permease [Bacillus sp. DTU_2020_1000418_1_SI_GHA_SEK_038]|uniref:SulP family inorganic anion transporter n=1 Tax=Bacillus sp. DTU_2020_1000418_1_SI_GHA_SEK_038 TaxID=3077585 RepID=UPI0028E6A9B7|nr:sulfate permease [Bacillus sp. DTU_2020_1000418_1_SI_GHA_SEK_038]WNS73588.1 sulfate permease [Bacillus sp. DTU_2020_1000418_1_SI_GHA_SEK_038]